MQHFPSLERPEIVELLLLRCESLHRSHDFTPDFSFSPRPVKSLRIRHPIEELWVPDKDFRHVRASTEAPDKNLHGLRRTGKVRKELRFIQARPSKPFEVRKSLVGIGGLRDAVQQLAQN